MQLCLENGVKLEELLPPLEPGKTSHECNYKVSNHPSSHEHEEGKQSNHENCSKKSGNLSLAEVSPPMAVKHKRKRRKGKCKKRLMVDILAVAQHSTLEEIDGVNRFCDAETVIEGSDEAVPCQHISMAEAVNEDSCRKGGSEEHVM